MIEVDPAAPRGRTCALVLGMHRSGTSAVTRMISLIGAGLPKHVMAAHESNEAGHWEPNTLVDLNDEMLHEGGSAWNDWRPFDPLAALGPKRLAHYRSEIMRGIEEQFEGKALFVLKDPRISRFTQLYLDCLAGLGIGVKVVLTSRHPLEVAESLQKRNSTPREYALRLWLRHDLDAEAATRNVERMLISYDSAIGDPDAAIVRLRDHLASAIPDGARIDIDAARASLRPELRHQREGGSAPAAKDSLLQWAETAEAAFAALERDAADDESKATLDRLRARIDEEALRSGDDFAYLIRDAARIGAELADVTRQRNGLQESLNNRKRQHVVDLASCRRAWVQVRLPKQLSPWRTFKSQKRQRIRRLREDYIAILNSPLFDADHYMATYPDVVATGLDPILHYLSYGSREGRWPNAAVNPIECKAFFPELGEGDGNLVLRLIELYAPEPPARSPAVFAPQPRRVLPQGR